MDNVSETLETLGGGAAGSVPSNLIPPENALDMADQSFKRWYGVSPKTSFWLSLREHTLLARMIVFGIASGLTVYGVWAMWQVVGQNDATGWQYALVGLFAISFLWIALAAANSFLGFMALVSRIDWSRGTQHNEEMKSRTAILMPVYNEDTERVFATLQRMAEEVAASGHGWHFDFFILSDTTNLSIAHEERNAALRLRDSMIGRLNVYYRRRPKNTARKSGNIADFVRRWGGHYDHMLILDADSYMTADTIVQLAKAMEADSNAGLIQTVPRLVNRNTLFARMQQFATGTYGPVVSAGLALVQGREGNYWGHNAIIRVKAFAGSCGLPVLTGRAPFGGHIMSHDFVEAALLRRAGWDVYMRPDLTGSYEETPPTLCDHASRDRRWAQGNLQHMKVLNADGLHWISRYHLLTGIMSYLSSPLWLVFLLVGILLAWQASQYQPDYFPSAHALFPTWPQFDAQRAWTLLGFSAAVLLAPKLFAMAYALINKQLRQGAGGAIALVSSVVLETLLSALLAPVFMLQQTRFVAAIFLGHHSGWNPQTRDDGKVFFWPLVKRYTVHTLFGAAMAGITLAISWQLCLWLLPVWLGLILTIPLVYVTSLPSVGRAARWARLFLIPEEREKRDPVERLIAQPAAVAS